MPQMTPKEQKLNDFLVGVFNDILRLEGGQFTAKLRQSFGNRAACAGRRGPLRPAVRHGGYCRRAEGDGRHSHRCRKNAGAKGLFGAHAHKTDKRRVTVSLTGPHRPCWPITRPFTPAWCAPLRRGCPRMN